jgi:hypothetical protein
MHFEFVLPDVDFGLGDLRTTWMTGPLESFIVDKLEFKLEGRTWVLRKLVNFTSSTALPTTPTYKPCGFEHQHFPFSPSVQDGMIDQAARKVAIDAQALLPSKADSAPQETVVGMVVRHTS